MPCLLLLLHTCASRCDVIVMLTHPCVVLANNWATRIGNRFASFTQWKTGAAGGVTVDFQGGGVVQQPAPVTPPQPAPVTPPAGNGNNNGNGAATPPSCAPGAADKVPIRIPTTGGFDITVAYQASATFTVSVQIQAGGGGFFGLGKATCTAYIASSHRRIASHHMASHGITSHLFCCSRSIVVCV